ncbi:hypothetical protein TPHA_0P00220 [Tetrapisispora phaffii CBS 4417]|uniref:25S rRNA (Uridine(2843)-N(3))-methyltransferase n=1 Tax=Tetrapisispora phaffii (strain ATCC 24235 / CBS 4417 / NBRC 1672 / NRRL Y-8282 / UCD 70-5) TaxID=1071381 RepID=G8C202_TETPH|nr:hypothetical protein TPHA_0P00220 [Tetrapisispora phaffii CBS 4417]CCE66180.1 hypothetical protein TPHA_0P00220 [Tetrapisispora phaffii CBS 4417]
MVKTAQLPVYDKKSLPPQETVDLFKTAFFNELYGSETIDELLSQIQTVKTDLYNRDYLSAFENNVKRTAYCCRWSPSRATAYSSLFAHLTEVTDVLTCKDGEDQDVLCIGGGAGGELVAIASLFAPSRSFDSKYRTKRIESEDGDLHGTPTKTTLNLHLVDVANWENVLKRLSDTIEDRWLYQGEMKYFNTTFTNKNILEMSNDEMHISNLNLITLLFTTNEIFTEHKTESVKLFQKFNKSCKKGCYLLIVESAGSYSNITIGSKVFPIHFLVDTILVGKRSAKKDFSGGLGEGSWSLIKENDNIWYRGDTQLDYPMKLENMRIFYRLYRKN